MPKSSFCGIDISPRHNRPMHKAYRTDASVTRLSRLATLSFVILCAALPNSALATTLTLQEVMHSVRTHHPLVKAAVLKREQVEAKRRAADGAFDWQYSQDGAARTSGYYDGWYTDHEFVKPIPDYNAKFSAGYRISDGDFPVYESVNQTMTGGEFNVGLSLSLMKDRDIDSKRYKQQQAELDVQIARQSEELSINKLLQQGADAYLAWYQAVEQLHIVEELVALAEARQQAITTRVEQGDLAAMAKDEFLTTLLARQEALLKAKQQVQLTVWELSLFWRDMDGRPRYAQVNDVPTSEQALTWNLVDLPALDLSRSSMMAISMADAPLNTPWKHRWLATHPEMRALDGELRKVQQQKRLASNNLLPTVDVSVKLARDIGSGSNTLDGTESRIGLNISVPLERTTAKANIDVAAIKKRELLERKMMLRERLSRDLQALELTIQNLQVQTQLSEQRATIAKKLVRQEQQRFDAGDSDLFRLNARETTSGQAQINALNARVKWLSGQVKLLAMGAQLDDLIH